MFISKKADDSYVCSIEGMDHVSIFNQVNISEKAWLSHSTLIRSAAITTSRLAYFLSFENLSEVFRSKARETRSCTFATILPFQLEFNSALSGEAKGHAGVGAKQKVVCKTRNVEWNGLMEWLSYTVHPQLSKLLFIRTHKSL